MRIVPSLALIVLAAVSAAPAASQTPAPSPTPMAQPCGDCGQLEALRAQEEALRNALDERYEKALEAHETLMEKGDTASQANYARMKRDYDRARRDYGALVERLISAEVAQAQRAAAVVYRDDAGMGGIVAPRAPSGWLGIVFSLSYTTYSDSGRQMMRFKDYPVVESVEPDSPADKGGVESQDMVVALAGRDVLKGTLSFHELLRPGYKLQLTLKRGTETLDRSVTVERRPSNWEAPGNFAPKAPMAPMPPKSEAPAAPEGAYMRSPLPPNVRWAPNAPGSPEVRVSIIYDNLTLAGAHVQQFAALKDYFGVDSGLLVLSVLPGTPAAKAGLRDGDVITRASGQAVSTPMQLAKLIGRAHEGSLTLDIMRQRKKATVTLKL